MPIRAYKNHEGTLLTTSLQTLVTFSHGLITGGAVVKAIQATTTSSTPRLVSIYLIPQGQVASAQYLLFRGTLPVDDTVPIPGGPWYGNNACFVQAVQDAGNDVALRVTAFEES